MLSLTIPDKSIPERTISHLFFDQEGLEAGAEIVFVETGLTLPVSLLQGTKASVLLPDSLSKGRYNVYARNTNGQRSKASLLEFHGSQSFLTQDLTSSHRKDPILDQRVLILPAPLKERTDTQKVEAGSQFTGEVPDLPYTPFGSGGGPTKGGRWCYNADVKIVHLEFTSQAIETRAAGSGFYIRRKGTRTEYLELDLSGNDQYLSFNEELTLKKGDVLLLKTVGAASEMSASITVKSVRLGLGRVG